MSQVQEFIHFTNTKCTKTSVSKFYNRTSISIATIVKFFLRYKIESYTILLQPSTSSTLDRHCFVAEGIQVAEEPNVPPRYTIPQPLFPSSHNPRTHQRPRVTHSSSSGELQRTIRAFLGRFRSRIRVYNRRLSPRTQAYKSITVRRRFLDPREG